MGARDCCNVRHSSRSCATIVSDCKSAGELAIVNTVCNTLRSEGSSAEGSCARAISWDVIVGNRCGATALCEIMRWTEPSAASGSPSLLLASASMKGTRISSEAATCWACSAAGAEGEVAFAMLRRRRRARSAASLTSGNLRASRTSDNARKSCSMRCNIARAPWAAHTSLHREGLVWGRSL